MPKAYYYTLPQQLVGTLLYWTGYRFDKSWRWAETGPKAWVYTWTGSTVGCNFYAADKVEKKTGEPVRFYH